MIEFEDDLIEVEPEPEPEPPKEPTPEPTPEPSPEPPKEPTPEPPREPTPEPPLPENNLKKAVDSACGKMDDQNRITSGMSSKVSNRNNESFLGPLKNRKALIEWLSSIHFEGDIMMMLADGDLLFPKQWLGGGKSNGELITFHYKKKHIF